MDALRQVVDDIFRCGRSGGVSSEGNWDLECFLWKMLALAKRKMREEAVQFIILQSLRKNLRNIL